MDTNSVIVYSIFFICLAIMVCVNSYFEHKNNQNKEK